MTPLVIVIPTKNRRALLERALASVFSQTYAPYRVVVVNDGSSDDTRTYLDSLTDERLTIIHHPASRGVNAARNAAYRALKEGEWAVPLDDDDYFLPGAFATIGEALAGMPALISVVQFATRFRTPEGREEAGGFIFFEGETFHDFTYEEAMTGRGLRMRGEARPAFKWTLFPHHLFQEDINGFEGEWWMKAPRDGVGIRFVKTAPVMMIDWAHPGEHLYQVAARRDPRSFLRANLRVLRDHAPFLLRHPRSALERIRIVLRLALRIAFGYTESR